MKKIYILLLAIASITFAEKAKAQCTAAFTYVTTADTVDFTDASTTSLGTIVSWGWNFGDGTFSTTQNPSHVYTACGIYNVSLTIATTSFCTNTYSTNVTVSGGITPSFTYNVDTTSGDVSFQPQPLGFNLNYIWDFGDGTYDSTVAPNHTYPTGTYNVCLTVYDDDSLCTATICDSVAVYVSPTSCASTFTYNDNGNGNVNFTASPFDFDITYNWDYGDGTTGIGAFAFHTYPLAGSYYVCLTAVDSATMCTSVFCDSVILVADPSACNFTFSYFDNNGQVGFTSNPPTFSSYTWDFGDGQTGTGAATSNTYVASGTYYVCATITDGFNSCTNTYCDSVVVSITGILENNTPDFLFSVYPNPANDQVTIEYQLTQSSIINIEVFDIVGNKISASTVSQTTGKHQTIINIEQLSQGAYFIKLSSEMGNSSKLIIKK
ncbi:MAG TPA: PKD domain-containing protein [Bacteroidia bacterium]|nr:PKD domain-containing protein [Bacteroidia bacterium]